MASKEYSIVEYYAEHEGYRCGYCKSTDSNYSHGMWAHSLTVDDYQDLIDRGWRRSGRYCYKPTMPVTCCPMYTIKCAALEFKLTKSQKKVLKRVQRFLSVGDTKAQTSYSEGSDSLVTKNEGTCESGVSEIPELHPRALGVEEKNVVDAQVASMHPTLLEKIGLGYLDGVISDSLSKLTSLASDVISNQQEKVDDSTVKTGNKTLCRPGQGPDESRPRSKKAKLVRLEHKQKKLLSQGLSVQDTESILKTKCKPKVPQEKSLEDFINEALPDNAAHRLEVRLVQSQPPSREFEEAAKEEFEVYRKYQMAVHGDSAEKCTMRQYTRFLVNSPLKLQHVNGGPPQGYGSFHQQYWLDGRLIAVGVIDILPRCISSVYFYYDPDLGHLSLGTYASLRELTLTRSLHQHAPNLLYYYMGFYIHTCPKMRYKASYSPSYLLCPEVYSWHPIEKCLPKLEASKYSRLDDNVDATDSNGNINLNEVLVLSHQRAMPYHIYKVMERNANDAEEVVQYATLVGMKCAARMLLVRA